MVERVPLIVVKAGWQARSTAGQARVGARCEQEARARGVTLPHCCVQCGIPPSVPSAAAEVVDGGSSIGGLEPQESSEARSIPAFGRAVERGDTETIMLIA